LPSSLAGSRRPVLSDPHPLLAQAPARLSVARLSHPNDRAGTVTPGGRKRAPRAIYARILAAADSMEEGLRHAGLAGVAGELSGRLTLTASRRLQLAAEHSGVTCFALRRSRTHDGPEGPSVRKRTLVEADSDKMPRNLPKFLDSILLPVWSGPLLPAINSSNASVGRSMFFRRRIARGKQGV